MLLILCNLSIIKRNFKKMFQNVNDTFEMIKRKRQKRKGKRKMAGY